MVGLGIGRGLGLIGGLRHRGQGQNHHHRQCHLHFFLPFLWSHGSHDADASDPFAALGSAAAPFDATIAGWSRLPSAAHDRIFKFNKTKFVLFSAYYLRAVRNCGAL
jgi:hypothetical protein